MFGQRLCKGTLPFGGRFQRGLRWGDDLIDDRLKNVIVEVAGGSVEPSEVVEGRKLREELGFDSVALVDLIVALEATFGIYVDPLEVDLTKVFESTTTLREFLQDKKGRG
ncbi:MAG: hypothetical protein C0609_09540 [Deltaproteobacteria bacterium]|nr:MAG: hypothetical protein C0609_09540 [Deltaproteobacteria bacterium]